MNKQEDTTTTIQKRKMKRRAAAKRKKNIATTIFLIFLFFFLFYAYKLVSYTLESAVQENNFHKLEQSIDETRKNSNADITIDASKKILPEYAQLSENNPDFWGWVKIDGTSLSYPVMHTPQDSEYYLNKDFERNDAQSGTPFLDGNCFDSCGNYIIYGHNMKNGTMFASLMSYKDEAFYKEHPTILLDTLYEHSSYSVIAAFYSKAYFKEDTDVWKYYQYTDLTDEETFNAYISQATASSLYKTDADVKFGDQLLTLSTCSYHTENGRFVVVAKKNASL